MIGPAGARGDHALTEGARAPAGHGHDRRGLRGDEADQAADELIHTEHQRETHQQEPRERPEHDQRAEELCDARDQQPRGAVWVRRRATAPRRTAPAGHGRCARSASARRRTWRAAPPVSGPRAPRIHRRTSRAWNTKPSACRPDRRRSADRPPPRRRASTDRTPGAGGRDTRTAIAPRADAPRRCPTSRSPRPPRPRVEDPRARQILRGRRRVQPARASLDRAVVPRCLVHLASITSPGGHVSGRVSEPSVRTPPTRRSCHARQPTIGSIESCGIGGLGGSRHRYLFGRGSGEAHQRGSVSVRRQLRAGARQVRLPETLDRQDPVGRHPGAALRHARPHDVHLHAAQVGDQPVRREPVDCPARSRRRRPAPRSAAPSAPPCRTAARASATPPRGTRRTPAAPAAARRGCRCPPRPGPAPGSARRRRPPRSASARRRIARQLVVGERVARVERRVDRVARVRERVVVDHVADHRAVRRGHVLEHRLERRQVPRPHVRVGRAPRHVEQHDDQRTGLPAAGRRAHGLTAGQRAER